MQPIENIRSIKAELVDELFPSQEHGEASDSGRAISCGHLLDKVFEDVEKIAFELERGEIGLLVAMPNAGKTTLALNSALCLCAGKAFDPVVEPGQPRKVLVIDAETRQRRLRRDLEWLLREFSYKDRNAVRENLFLMCETEIDHEPLSLTNELHLAYVTGEVARIKPDFIVIDTLAATFHVYSENDNAEQNRKVWRPLQKLARTADAAILVTHHIGKQRTEEGASPDRIYRARGASSAGASARAVWTLDVDKITRLTTLGLVKAKGREAFDTSLSLDGSRWFKPVSTAATKTVYGHLLDVVSVEMSTREIVLEMAAYAAKRTVEDLLHQAVHNGHLLKTKRGKYCPPTADSATPALLPIADSAVNAEVGASVRKLSAALKTGTSIESRVTN